VGQKTFDFTTFHLWGSSVSTVTMLWAGKEGIFSLLRHVQTGSGVQCTFSSMIRFFLLRG